jgi:hypothetical protein
MSDFLLQKFEKLKKSAQTHSESRRPKKLIFGTSPLERHSYHLFLGPLLFRFFQMESLGYLYYFCLSKPLERPNLLS